MREEREISGSHHRKYGSQQISVPFLWEHKPGLPKMDWISQPVSLVAADIPAEKTKPTSSGETATMPLQYVISVPFQWEEKPGKPVFIMDRASFPSGRFFMRGEDRNFDPFALDRHSSSFGSDKDYLPSGSPNTQATFGEGLSEETDSIMNESWHSVSERNFHCDSSVSAMQIGWVENSGRDVPLQVSTPDFADVEVKVKNCTAGHSRLVKRTLSLGELMLLSCKLSHEGNPTYVRKRRLFTMEFIRNGLLACFLFRIGGPKKQCHRQQEVGLKSHIAL